MLGRWNEHVITDFIKINPKVSLDKHTPYSFVEMKDLNPNLKYALPSTKKDLKGGARFADEDTLFARITPCLENGKICQVKNLDNGVGFGSTEFLVFRGKEGVSDSDFVYYLSRDPGFRNFAEANMIGTSGRQRVSKDAFFNLVLKLPPLPEQKAIASILSAIDDKIELNLQMNKTLEEMAMTLYKHWFVDFGPFKDGNFVESELGMIPEGWEVCKISDCIKLIGGYAFKSKDWTDNGMSVVKIKNISSSKVSLDGCSYVSSSITSNIDDKFLIHPGDTLIAMTGAEVGKVGIVPDYNEPLWLNQRVANIKENESKFENSSFLVSSFFHLKESYDTIQNLAYGSAQPNISLTGIGGIKLALPKNKDILIDVNNSFKNFHLKRVSNYSQNHILQNLRNTLLPKLISGQVRLKEFEKQISEAL